MQFSDLKANLFKTLTVIIVAVVFLWSTSAGWSKGKNLAEAEQVVANADLLTKGLDFFYNDQDRYPTAVEYESSIMSNYFQSFPPHDFTSSKCPESYSYKRNSANEYVLGFCLPIASAGFKQGWNSSTQNR